MRWRFALLAVLVASLMSVPTFAQDQGGGGGGGGPGGGGGGGGGGRGGFGGDPAQFRQQMMDRFKEQLKSSDEEWQVLQPKVEAVLTAQRNARAGGMFGMWGGGRRGGGGGRGPGGPAGGGGGEDTELGRASRELRTLLESDGADPKDIAARLEAYRAARAKADEQLKTARAELKDLVTQRQEAVLVMAGLLE